MAKKQTRRSVSIRGTTYERIRAYCERNDLSMSEFVEDLISKFFSGTRPAGGRSVTVSSVEPPIHRRPVPSVRKVSKLDPDQLQDAARFFTF